MHCAALRQRYAALRCSCAALRQRYAALRQRCAALLGGHADAPTPARDTLHMDADRAALPRAAVECNGIGAKLQPVQPTATIVATATNRQQAAEDCAAHLWKSNERAATCEAITLPWKSRNIFAFAHTCERPSAAIRTNQRSQFAVVRQTRTGTAAALPCAANAIRFR